MSWIIVDRRNNRALHTDFGGFPHWATKRKGAKKFPSKDAAETYAVFNYINVYAKYVRV